jgi:hypothetical protein
LIESVAATTINEIAQSGGDTQIFDPKPFIRSFEALSENINKIKKKIAGRIEDQEDQILASSGSKNRAFQEYIDAFDVCIF